MRDKVSDFLITLLLIVTVGITGWLVFTFGKWVYEELTTEYTYKEIETTATISRMEYEEGEWESKPKTKEVKKSDGSTTTETVYVKEWDEPEYEIDFQYRDKDNNIMTYNYEEEESSELYDYLKDAKLMRGDTVDVKLKETYGNGEYRYSTITDIKVKGDKYRGMLNE